MIVTCTRCATHFQLEEARLPLKGARVRCSRCKQTFFLAHPHADRTDAVRSAAREALAERVPRVLEPSEGAAEKGGETVPSRSTAPLESGPDSELDSQPQESGSAVDLPLAEGESPFFGSMEDLAQDLDPELGADTEPNPSTTAESTPLVREPVAPSSVPSPPAVSLGRLQTPTESSINPGRKISGVAEANDFGWESAFPEASAVGVVGSDPLALESLPSSPAARWHSILFGLGHALGWGATLALLLMGLANGL